MYVTPLKTRRSRRLTGLLQCCLLASILLGLIYSSEGSVFRLGFSPLQACNAPGSQQVKLIMHGSSSAQVSYQKNWSTSVECQAQRMLVLWRATSVTWIKRQMCIAR